MDAIVSSERNKRANETEREIEGDRERGRERERDEKKEMSFPVDRLQCGDKNTR